LNQNEKGLTIRLDVMLGDRSIVPKQLVTNDIL
jgi:hypothetical protein